MKATHLSCAALLGICMGLAPAASADEKADDSQPEKLFQTLDKNGDGKIAAEEIGEDRAKYFRRLVRVGDDDKDGLLSKEEFLSATKPEPKPVVKDQGNRQNKKKAKGKKGKQNLKKLFKRLDKNQDGVISQDEINAEGVPQRLKKRMGRLLEKLDKDELTLEDLKKSIRGKAKAKGVAKKKPTAEKSKKGKRNPEQAFKKLDENGDGKITLAEVPEEFKPRLTRLLKRAGKDEDGNINLNEFRRVSRRADDAEAPPRRGPEAGRRRGGPPRPPALFGMLDANKDRKLSKEELSRVVELFEELDKNDDGSLDPRELYGFPGRRGPDGDRPRPPRGRRDRRPEVAQGDRPDRSRRPEGFGRGFGRPFMEGLGKNGKISIEEALNRIKKRMEKLDTNGDGYLDAEEFRAARPGDRFGFRGRRGPDGERPGRRGPRRGRPEGAEGRGADFSRRILDRLDENQDGKISSDEARGPLKEHFEKIDGNSDGYLDTKELKKGREKRDAKKKKKERKKDSAESNGT